MTITKYLNPRNDLVFKKIFGTEKNKDILLHFLNDIVVKQGKPKIQKVTLLNTSVFPDIAAQKQSVVDVLCEDEDKVQYIVEMQVAKVSGFEKRAQHYAAKVYGSQAVKGGNYDTLKEVIFLAITEYPMFPKKKGYKSTHVTLDENSLEHDLKGFSFTFIELPKFTKEFHELETFEDKWYYFFKHADDPDDVDELIKNSPEIIKRACEVIAAHNWTKEELVMYEERERAATDLQSTRLAEITDAKAEGEAVGIEKGEKKEQIRIAKEMLTEGLEITVVAKITNLSEYEIKKLK